MYLTTHTGAHTFIHTDVLLFSNILLGHCNSNQHVLQKA